MEKTYRLGLMNVVLALSILTCFTSSPYIGHYLFGGAYMLVSGVLSLLVFGVSYYYWGRHLDVWMKILLLFMFSFFVYGSIMMIYTSSHYDMRKAIGVALKCLFVIGSCYIMKKRYEQYAKYFLTINAWITIGSIILFFLLLLGIQWDPITFIKADGRTHYVYFPLGASNARYQFGDFIFLRIAGFADEPGAMALILIYLLVLNEITLKSRKLRIVYMIGACLTFSMAFFITVTPIILYWIKTKVLRFNLKTLFASLVLCLGLFVFIPQDSAIHSGLDFLVFNRFRANDDGELNGDNRSFAIPVQIEAFKSSPVLGVGSSQENVENYDLGFPSFYSYLAMHGLFGYIFFYIPFLYLCYKNLYKKELLLLIAIGMNYLQRPCIEDMFSLLCLSLFFYASQKSVGVDNNSVL